MLYRSLTYRARYIILDFQWYNYDVNSRLSVLLLEQWKLWLEGEKFQWCKRLLRSVVFCYVHMHVLFSSIIIMISMKLPCVVHLAKRWSFSSTVSVRWLSPLSSIQVDILWFNNTCIHFAWKKFLGRTYFELISRSRYKKSAIFRTHYFKFFFSVCFMLCILLFHPPVVIYIIYIIFS